MGCRSTGLAARRAAMGYTQEKFAEEAGVDRSTAWRWEAGKVLPLPAQRPRIAKILRVSLEQLDLLLGETAKSRRTVESSCAQTTDTSALPHDLRHLPEPYAQACARLRRIVDVYDLPSDGPVRALGELRKATLNVITWRLNSDYLRLVERLPSLLTELTRSLFLRSGVEREQVAAMLVQAYRAADAIADKLELYDLSGRIIHVMRWAADQAGDELALATTSYVRTETFFASGQLEVGRQMLERAADQLRPGVSVDEAAIYGSLHMRAAVVAARAGLSERAREHIAEARRTSAGVTEGVYQGTAFGPASVRIHEVTLAMDLGAPDRALAVADGWVPPGCLPGERRSHFHVDIARAHMLMGHRESVFAALDEARRAAPEHVRVHPQVREILATMSTERDVRYRLRAFASRAGIPYDDHLLS